MSSAAPYTSYAKLPYESRSIAGLSVVFQDSICPLLKQNQTILNPVAWTLLFLFGMISISAPIFSWLFYDISSAKQNLTSYC